MEFVNRIRYSKGVDREVCRPRESQRKPHLLRLLQFEYIMSNDFGHLRDMGIILDKKSPELMMPSVANANARRCHNFNLPCWWPGNIDK